MRDQAADVHFYLRTLDRGKSALKDDFPIPAIDVQYVDRSHICVINSNSGDIISMEVQPNASLSAPSTEENFVVLQALDKHGKVAPLEADTTEHRILFRCQRTL